MRIAHVTEFYLPRLGGIELHVSDLAARQAALGHEVTVVTSTPAGEGDVAGGVPVVRVTDGFRWRSPLHPAAPAAAARAVLAGDYDVVHVHVAVGSPVSFWTASRAARSGIPTVVTVHSLWAWVHPLFRVLALLTGAARLPVTWTAVSEAAAAPVRRALGPEAQVSVLPNGIDPDAWSARQRSSAGPQVRVVAVMRLAARKRPLPLLRMMRHVRAQLPAGVQVRLTVVGDGPARPSMQRYLRRHTMADYVDLPGRCTREQIAELFRSADVFVAPADLESFGIAALEARCAGLPVVAKRATGIASFVVDGVDGLLVDDDREMAAALGRLCADTALREALARGAAEPVSVTWTSTLALTEETYALAVDRVGARSRPEAPLALAS